MFIGGGAARADKEASRGFNLEEWNFNCCELFCWSAVEGDEMEGRAMSLRIAGLRLGELALDSFVLL